ncbi:MAG: hypothetical protein ACI9Y1_003152, partial [Lentisphaeria bacterium]
DEESLQQASVRAPRGGRKELIEAMSDIDKAFLDVLSSHTAGDSMDDKAKWTALSRSEISNALKKGFRVSRNIVRQLLKNHGYVKRKPSKNRSTGEYKERDRKFKKINRLISKFEREGSPIISIDPKIRKNSVISIVMVKFTAWKPR